MSGAAYPVAVCAALADETRWDILRRLGEESRSASELADLLPVSRQAIAKHLGVLAEVGLVEPSREGRQVRYRALGQQLTAHARPGHDRAGLGGPAGAAARRRRGAGRRGAQVKI